MRKYKYLQGVSTLQLNKAACIGCGQCLDVCPHAVFALREKKAEIVDFDSCMECGACATNCPVDAVTVSPGAGCASLIFSSWLSRLTGGRYSGGCC